MKPRIKSQRLAGEVVTVGGAGCLASIVAGGECWATLLQSIAPIPLWLGVSVGRSQQDLYADASVPVYCLTLIIACRVTCIMSSKDAIAVRLTFKR